MSPLSSTRLSGPLAEASGIARLDGSGVVT
jgi:hypothetical protein